MIIDRFLVHGLRKPAATAALPTMTVEQVAMAIGLAQAERALQQGIKQACLGLARALKRPPVQSDFVLLNGPGKGGPDV